MNDQTTRAPRNESMNRAKEQKNNEFYTQLSDVEAEIIESGSYDGCFQDKTVLCNCNDLMKGNFMRFFMNHFEDLGLKRLITVSYGENAVVAVYDGRSAEYIPLTGDGDFRSEDGIRILQHADVVVTNPPFSLFRDFLLTLVKHDKQFLIVGNVVSSMSCKNIFPLYINGMVWFGNNKIKYFKTPEGNLHTISYTGWFTNMGNPNPPKQFVLTKQYAGHESEYLEYDNYPAISVDKCKDIPLDYYGEMGVPSSYLFDHDPTQFEIVGTSATFAGGAFDNRDGKFHKRPGRFYVNGDKKTERIVIRRRT